MSLTLTWEDRNWLKYDGVEIYRSDSRDGNFIYVGQVGSDVTEFTDTSMSKENVVYYYKLVTVRQGSDDVDSIIYPVGFFPTGTGPGPQTIHRGDWDVGYFGTVDVGSLPNANDIAAGFGYAGASNMVTTWHKLVADGKIIFVPNVALLDSVAVTQALQDFSAKGDSSDDVVNYLINMGYAYSARLPYLTGDRRRNKSVDSGYSPSSDESIQYGEIAAMLSMRTTLDLDLYGAPRKLIEAHWNNTLPMMTGTRAGVLAGDGETEQLYALGVQYGSANPYYSDASNRSIFIVLEMLFD